VLYLRCKNERRKNKQILDKNLAISMIRRFFAKIKNSKGNNQTKSRKGIPAIKFPRPWPSGNKIRHH